VADTTEVSSLDLEDIDSQQSTIWLGTEDGCIHVYNSSDNIRIKKNKIRLQHGSSILSIIYLDNRVFISLANGDMIIYDRDSGEYLKQSGCRFEDFFFSSWRLECEFSHNCDSGFDLYARFKNASKCR
jgi:hypothetical protein